MGFEDVVTADGPEIACKLSNLVYCKKKSEGYDINCVRGKIFVLVRILMVLTCIILVLWGQSGCLSQMRAKT